MNTWKVILATLVIFGTGVIAGGFVAGYVDRGQPRAHRVAPTGHAEPAVHGQTSNYVARESGRSLANPPQLLRKDYLQNLGREVQLTPEQHERIEKIISEGQERTKQLWEQIAPAMRQEMVDVKGRIRAVLTPEQRGKFEELMKQRPRETRRPAPVRTGIPPETTPPPAPPQNP